MLTNARFGSVIGEIIKNAVPINALHNKSDGVQGTYAMAAYAIDAKSREFVAIVTVEERTGEVNDIEFIHSVHSIGGRQKKSSQADTKSQGVADAQSAYTKYAADYRNSHPNATRADIYDDAEFQRLFDAEDALVGEWVRETDDIAIQCKEEITNILYGKINRNIHCT